MIRTIKFKQLLLFFHMNFHLFYFCSRELLPCFRKFSFCSLMRIFSLFAQLFSYSCKFSFYLSNFSLCLYFSFLFAWIFFLFTSSIRKFLFILFLFTISFLFIRAFFSYSSCELFARIFFVLFLSVHISIIEDYKSHTIF